MASEDNKVVISLDADSKELLKKLSKVEKQSEKIGDDIGENIADGISDGAKKGSKKATNRAKVAGATYGLNFAKAANARIRAVTAKGLGLSKGAITAFSNLGRAATVGFAAATGGALAAGFAIKKFTDAAAIQQDAINKLNISLKASGRFTQEASQDFQDYASSLQEVTKFGDEVILENAALIQSLGQLDQDGLKKATSAALDLSAALGISLNSAATLVGKAATGEISSFTRYGVVIEKGANQAETFANALDALNTKFGGAAAGQVNTFSGAVAQASNAFGDLLENIGFGITQSDKFKSVIETLGKTFADLGKGLNADSVTIFFNEILVETVRFVQSAIVPVIRGFRLLGEVADIVFPAIRTGFGFVALAGVKAAQALVTAFEFFGKSVPKSVKEGLTEAEESITGFFVRNAEKTNEALQNNNIVGAIFDTSEIESKSEEILGNIERTVNRSNEIIAEGTKFDPITGEVKGEEEEEVIDPADTGDVFSGISDGFTDVGDKANAARADVLKFSKDAGKALREQFARGAGAAFASFGKALATGDDALKAFGKALLGAFGQILVQLGTGFILQGITQSLAVPGSGTALIASGAALATFGGALSGLSGGSGSGGGIGAGGGGTFASDGTSTISSEAQQVQQDPNTGVTVNIQGDVLDSEDTGLRIVDLISDSFDKDDVRVTGGLA